MASEATHPGRWGVLLMQSENGPRRARALIIGGLALHRVEMPTYKLGRDGSVAEEPLYQLLYRISHAALGLAIGEVMSSDLRDAYDVVCDLIDAAGSDLNMDALRASAVMAMKNGDLDPPRYGYPVLLADRLEAR